MPRPKCFVFKFFKKQTKSGKTFYKCKFCYAEYTQHATRMKRHLEKCKKCPKEIQKSLSKNDNDSEKSLVFKGSAIPIAHDSSGSDNDNEDTADQLSSSSSRNAMTATAPFLKSFLDSMPKEEKTHLDKHLARAIYSSGTPLSITEHPEWIKFFKIIRPSYDLPSRYELSAKLLNKEYDYAKEKIKKKIKGATTVGLQCDGWSNIRNQHIVNYVVTTPSPILFKTYCTEAEKQTSEYIASEIKGVIEKIGKEKVLGLVTDNAAAMVKARKTVVDEIGTGLIEYGCIAYCLNILIGDIMKCPSLKNIISRCKEIVKEINGSHLLLATLNKFQIEKRCSTISLKLPVVTRWGSTLACFESLFVNKYSLKMLAVSEETASKLSQTVKKRLDDEIFWVQIKKLISILKHVVFWITKLEGDDCNMSSVMEAFYMLEEKFKAEVPGLPVSAKEEKDINSFLQERKTMIVSGIHFASNILDPNLRGKHLSLEEHSQGMDFINSIAVANHNFQQNECEIIVELAHYVGKSDFFAKSYLWKNLDKMDAITWWQGYCSKLAINKLAVGLLSLPPTSAAARRTFSKYSLIHTKKRNRLTVDRAGKLAYIACNINLCSKSKTSRKRTARNNSHEECEGTKETIAGSSGQQQKKRTKVTSESETTEDEEDIYSLADSETETEEVDVESHDGHGILVEFRHDDDD